MAAKPEPEPDKFRDLRQAAHCAALRACAAFAGLPMKDIEHICAFAQPRQVKQGEYLFREGDPARGFFVIRRGAVNVHRVGGDGTEKVIQIFRAGESFAEGALGGDGGPGGAGGAEGGSVYPANARAVEDGEVLFIPRREFMELLGTHSDLALRMIGLMSQRLRLLVNALEDLQGKDVETRLLNWLLKRCPLPRPAGPVEIALDVTKSLLASELSTRSETLSRALARLRDAGQIEVEGKRIRVRSAQALEGLFRSHLGEGG